MFDTKDILTRLKNGETMESIAAEMTQALNDAQDAYEAETAKATRDTMLESAAETLIDALLDYLYIIDPSIEEICGDEDIEELRNLLINEADNIKAVIDLGRLLATSNVTPGPTMKPKMTVTKVSTKPETSLEDILAEFLKDNGLS